MSQATSTATSGGITLGRPSAGQNHPWLFRILAAAIRLGGALFKRK